MNHDTMNAISGAKGAVTVAAGTVGIGIAEKIDLLNGVLGAVSISVGIIVGIMVIRKTHYELSALRAKEHRRRKEDRESS